MKLLFVHQNFGDFGGAETNIHIAASELQQRGHHVALLYRHSTGRNEASWQKLFPHSFRLPGPGHVETVEAVLEQFQPDLVYLHNLDDLAVLESLLRCGRPVVRMVHDHEMYCLRGYKYNYFTRKICTRPASGYCVFPCLAPLARNRGGMLPLRWASYAEKRREIQLNQECDAVVTYSEHVKGELVGNGFAADKIELCVPLRFRNEDDRFSSLSARNLLLFAGQLIRGKGVDVLLKALAKVETRFECVILGDGNHRRRCESLCARLGLSGRVRFEGYVPPSESKEYYLEASVFLMSSLWPEPFGMAGPEAMRYGVPVVAFDAGGIREWLHDGENGFLAPWGDTQRYARAIDALLRNKELARRLGRQARESIRRYEVGAQVDKLERLFQRVLHAAEAPNTFFTGPEPIVSAYE